MDSEVSGAISLSSYLRHPRSAPPAWALVDFRDGDHDEADRQVPPATAPTAPSSTVLSRSLASPPPRMSSPEDFKFLNELGCGSWSTVMEAVHTTTNKRYAVKILSKAQLIKQNKAKYATVEKDALAKLSGTHPGIVKMYAAFQDQSSLYFVLDLASHGDLAALVKEFGSLSLRCTQWYTAQIVDAILWMHSKDILHRDMKPENVLLDDEMRVKLTDFGSAYIAPQGDLSPRSSTFVGSAAYVSPELLDRTSKSTSNSSDIWAIGCTIFFMVTGSPAFAAINDYQSFRKIEALDYTYPADFYDVARDLTQKLLVLDPASRLGVEPKSSATQLRQHPFFNGGDHRENGDILDTPIRWDTLWRDPPVPPETGIIKPTPSVVDDDEDDLWDNVVDEFSLVSVGPQATRPLSPTDLLPSGPPVEVPPDVIPCEVVEKVQTNEHSPEQRVNDTNKEDILDDATLKAKDWSNVLSPGEHIRYVVPVKTTLRRGLLKQRRPCALLLTSQPRVMCVCLEEKNNPPRQSDVKHVFTFQRPKQSAGKGGDKHTMAVSCRTDDSQLKLIIGTGVKEFRYGFDNQNALVGWEREVDSLLRPV